MLKLFPDMLGQSFQSIFNFKRPIPSALTYENLKNYSEQLVIFESINDQILFRGELIFDEDEKRIMFIGSPWITDVDRLTEIGLTLRDFAIHDPITELLQVIKTQEIVNNDIKEMAENLKAQKKKLEQQDFALNRSALVSITDKDGVIKEVNKKFEELSQFSKEELIGNTHRLVKSGYHSKPFYARMWKTISIGLVWNGEIKNTSKHGNDYWTNATIIPFLNSDGEPYQYMSIEFDITVPKNAQSIIRRSEEKYRNIMEAMELGILEVDNEDIIVNAYPWLCDMTGYAQEELLGKKATKTLLTEESQKIMAKQNKKRLRGQSGVYEVQLRKKNGELIWVVISGAPILNSKNEVTGSIGIHLDISERKKMEADLIEAKLNAEDSVAAKEIFLANMSHEIRTPMNAIIGMSNLMKKTHLTGRQDHYLNSIHDSAKNLLGVINDILDFSKIGSGKLEFESIGFRAVEVIESLINQAEYRTMDKDLYLHYEADEASKQVVLGDPFRLNQVLLNLISNAIKFTDKGIVEVRCTTVYEDENQLELEFSVKDTGIGIPADKIDSIFDSFNQAEKDTTRKYGGTGLGLSICKKLIELQGGNIKLESKEGEGSIFTFNLSYQKGAEQDLPVKKDSNTQIETSEIVKVLLVEDHEVNQFMAISFLEEWGFEVSVANNGKEAVNQLKEHEFDVILMDIQMPVMGGMEATEIIRNELRITTPIIALTANALKGDSEKYMNAGMNDYLSKPFEPEDLHYKIALLCKDKIKIKKKENSNKKTSHDIETGSYDLKKLMDMAGENVEFASKMIRMFIEKTPESINQMTEAMKKKDLGAVRDMAHKLKPSVDLMSVKELFPLLCKIESSIREETNVDQVPEWVSEAKSLTDQVIIDLQNDLKDSFL